MKYSTSPAPSLNNYPRSTSPLPAPANYQATTASAAVKRYKYLRRLFKFNQMDFEFAAWQMVYLFVAPQKVFRNFNYRKRKCFVMIMIYYRYMKCKLIRNTPPNFLPKYEIRWCVL